MRALMAVKMGQVGVVPILVDDDDSILSDPARDFVGDGGFS